jgi:serine protease Do
MRIPSTLSPRAVLIAIVLAVILSVQIGMVVGGGANSRVVAAPAVADQSKGMLHSFENAFQSIADQIEPSIVFIESERTIKASRSPFDFFGWGPSPRQQDQVAKASGSGVIVRGDGYILTNDHVVGGADRVTVTLSDKREFKGTVLRDPTTDLALVKISATNLPAAGLADSDKVHPGQWALAFGNPGGQQFTNSLTVGVVSAITREFMVPDPDSPKGGRLYPDAIQTDAAINPGNSGGPLVNIDGQIIGINAAIWSPTGSSVGIGFAIPSNTAKYVMQQLIDKGKVSHGKLGVLPKDLDGNLGQHYGVQNGALVASVDKGSAAEKAGVQVEDIITDIGGKKIDSAAALRSAVEKIAPGTKVPMVVVRNKKPMTLQVIVGEDTTAVASDNASGSKGLGVSVDELTPDVAKQLGVPTTTKGVVVESVETGTPADTAGFEQGMVVVKLAGKPTPTVEAFNAIADALKPGDRVVAIIQRGRYSDVLGIDME